MFRSNPKPITLILSILAFMAAGSSAARAVDCNNNGVEDAQDIAAGTSQDCQPDGVPDECQINSFTATSGSLSPIDYGHPQSFTISAPPPAEGPVTVTVRARTDLNEPQEKFTVKLNGAAIGEVFEGVETDCSEPPDADTLVVSEATFNSAIGGGNAVVELVPSIFVSAGTCAPSYAIIEVAYALTLDCNGNGVPDACDLASGSSDDCNDDQIPDDCQPEADCNANAVRDLCDIGAGTSQDCNANLAPDECDIAGGSSSDDNGNTVPDECDLAILAGNDVCVGGTANGAVCSNHGDCPGGRCHTKNRFASVTPHGTAGSHAIQVKVVDVPANRPAQQALMEGDIWWAGPPTVVSEGPPGGSFKAALLQCTTTPHLRPWGGEGLVHLYGPAVVPGTMYEVRLCDAALICSDPLVVTTATYGDIVPPLSATVTDFLDVSAVLDKFKGLPVAPSKTRAQLQPNTLNLTSNINFMDMSEVVNAFKGFVYSYSGASCP